MSAPGLAFASAISSFTFFAGTEGCTDRICGLTANSDKGANEASLSYWSVLYRCGAIAKVLLVPTSSVYPSGGDLDTNPWPIVPVAPARLSIMNCWPVYSVSFAARMRPIESVEPPAAHGTTTRTGLAG